MTPEKKDLEGDVPPTEDANSQTAPLGRESPAQESTVSSTNLSRLSETSDNVPSSQPGGPDAPPDAPAKPSAPRVAFSSTVQTDPQNKSGTAPTRKRRLSLRTSLFLSRSGSTTPTASNDDYRDTEGLEDVADDQSISSISSASSSGSADLDSTYGINGSRYSDAQEPIDGRNDRWNHKVILQKIRLKVKEYRLYKYIIRQRRKLRKAYKKLKSLVIKVKTIRPSKDGRHIPLQIRRTESSAVKKFNHLKSSGSITLPDERTGRPYIDNSIHTKRYSIWSFLPRQLIAQFCKVANFYFLCVSILQLIPGFSSTGRFTTLVPLVAFVTIAIVKEAIDDWRRAKGDREENRRQVNVASRGTPGFDKNVIWTTIEWQDIAVGDIVKVSRDEAIPADIVILNVPDSVSGIAYVETMALDGETNLKGRSAIPSLRTAWLEEEAGTKSSKTVVVAEDPNQDLYKFDGRVDESSLANEKSDVSPLSNSNIIYRGSVIRNTTTVIGQVVYTGEECKMRMNANHHVRIKAPRLQNEMNRVIVLIVLLVVFLSLGSTGSYVVWEASEKGNSWYLESASVGFGANLASQFLMFNTLIPISLYVSLEIVKLAQVWLMESDLDMWMPFNIPASEKATATETDESQKKTRFKWNQPKPKRVVDGVGCEAHTSTINEELGQVGYIFSDKTGTLTENEMQVRKFSVGGIVWSLEDGGGKGDNTGDDAEPTMASKAPRVSMSAPRFSMSAAPRFSMSAAPRFSMSNPIAQREEEVESNELTTAKILNYIKSNPESAFAKRVIWMLLGVVICHDALPEDNTETSAEAESVSGAGCQSTSADSTASAKPDPYASSFPHADTTLDPSQPEDDTPLFQSSSADEVALVQAAYRLGFKLVKRETNELMIEIPLCAALSIGYDASEDDLPSGSAAERNGTPVRVLLPILNLVPFSSKRKRMSVVVRLPSGKLSLFCKGADSVIMERLDSQTSKIAKKFVAEIEGRVEKWREDEVQAVLARESMSRPSFSTVGVSRPSISRPSFSQPIASRLSGSHAATARPSVSFPVASRHSMASPNMAIQIPGNTVASRPSISSPLDQLFDGEPRRERDHSLYAPRPSTHLNREDMYAEELEDEPSELVEESMASDDITVLKRCLQHIYDFSSDGYRTLLYAHKIVSQDDYDNWANEYDEAKTCLIDRDEKVETVGAKIEKDLEMGGGTAIEDRLQEGVPSTIRRLRQAGIRIWMLTGDKRETAINIGHSCGLIRQCSDVFVIGGNGDEGEMTDSTNMADLSNQVGKALSTLNSSRVAHSVVVIDGSTLAQINTERPLRKLFFALVLRANTVICCRASPSQKALLVHGVRKRSSHVTLAIGDGANDIAMIQEAHVGIGIAGREGLQAARISDYSIGQFRFLNKLLLVHGRWNYVRTCKYTIGTFSKEIVFYLSQALFQRYTQFSGTSLHEPWGLSMFNTLFTSLPVIFLGVFDQDIRAETLIVAPELYRFGIESRGFGIRIASWWLAIAALQSLIIYYIPLGLFFDTPPTSKLDGSIFPFGLMVFVAAVFLINIKLQILVTARPTFTNATAIGLSLLCIFAFNLVVGQIYDASSHTYFVRGMFINHIGASLYWWLGFILTTVAAVVFEICVKTSVDLMNRHRGDEDSLLVEALECDPVLRRRVAWEARPVLKASRGEWVGPVPEWTCSDEQGDSSACRQRSRRAVRQIRRQWIKFRRTVNRQRALGPDGEDTSDGPRGRSGSLQLDSTRSSRTSNRSDLDRTLDGHSSSTGGWSLGRLWGRRKHRRMTVTEQDIPYILENRQRELNAQDGLGVKLNEDQLLEPSPKSVSSGMNTATTVRSGQTPVWPGSARQTRHNRSMSDPEVSTDPFVSGYGKILS